MTTRDHPVDALLEHADFLRRLAVQLAGRDGADDLQQDAWLQSVAHPPRRGDSPRGWLRTVTGNLWHNTRRAAARRGARERAVATPGDVPAVDDIVAREEVRRRVVAAVLALPEPLREVVLLRYYEGLDSPAIGARLGRAPSTVRTQLQSALDRLRQRLDDEHDGQRAAWTAPLLCWHRCLARPVAGPGVWLLRTAALLALCAGVTLWWEWPAPDAPPGATVTAAVAADRDAAHAGEGPAASARSAPPAAWIAPAATPHTEARPRGRLRGDVRDQTTGAAIDGVRVHLRSLAERTTTLAELANDLQVARDAAAAADGTFAFADLPAGLYELVAADGAGRSGRTRATVGDGESTASLALAIEPFRGLVAVKVVDADGHAVIGATVALAATCSQHGAIGYDGRAPFAGVTDARGMFVCRDPLRLEFVFEGIATARAPDGRVGMTSIGRPEHRGYNPWFEVTVDRPGAIAGRLSGPRADWHGARVTAQPMWTYASVRYGTVGECAVAVAADGTFRIEQLPAGRYHLQVDGTDGLRQVLEKPVESWQFMPAVKVAAGECTAATIEFAAPAAAHGRVLDGDGTPIAGATVTALAVAEQREWLFWHHAPDEEPCAYRQRSARTDAVGAWSLALDPGHWHVAATAPGRSLAIEPNVAVGDAPVELEHRLVKDGSLRGRTARDVTLLRPRTGAAQRAVAQMVESSSGTFALRGLAPGPWEIGNWGEHGFATIATVTIQAGATTWIDLTAVAGPGVRGTAMIDGRPAPDLLVRADKRTTHTGPAGDFELELAPDQTGGSLVFAHRGLDFATAPIPDGPAAGRDLGAVELRARTLDVTCLDSNGKPTAATVWVEDRDLDHNERWFLADGRLTGQWIGAQGCYLYALFADGTTLFRELQGQRGKVALELRAEPTGALAVRLLDRDGAPRIGGQLQIVAWDRDRAAPTDGATFYAERNKERNPRHASTDADGRVVVRGLPAGPVLVWFSGEWSRFGYERGNVLWDGLPPAEQVATIAAGRTTEVELVLTR